MGRKIDDPIVSFRVAAAAAVIVPLLGLVGTPLPLARGSQAFAVAAATFSPLLLLGIWWRRLTDVGAATGLLLGGSQPLWHRRLHSAAGRERLAGRTLSQPAAWAMPLALANGDCVAPYRPSDHPRGGSHHDPAAHPEAVGAQRTWIARASGDQSGGLVAAARGRLGCARGQQLPTRPTPAHGSWIDGFVHEAGPPPSRFSWVTLGSHARRELHCASDQDHALFWETEAAHRPLMPRIWRLRSSRGLWSLGCAPVTAATWHDRWSYSVDQWQAILRERVKRRHRTRS